MEQGDLIPSICCLCFRYYAYSSLYKNCNMCSACTVLKTSSTASRYRTMAKGGPKASTTTAASAAPSPVNCAHPTVGACVEEGGRDADCCAGRGNAKCVSGYTMSFMNDKQWAGKRPEGFYQSCDSVNGGMGNTCCTKDEGCKDDPKGLLAASQVGETCAKAIKNGCNTYDADYEGYNGYIWEMCPVSCKRCGAATTPPTGTTAAQSKAGYTELCSSSSSSCNEGRYTYAAEDWNTKDTGYR